MMRNRIITICILVTLMLVLMPLPAGAITQQKKFESALSYFNQGDYASARQILLDIDGYGTSDSYLTECNRQLMTIEIKSPYAAQRIVDTLAEQGVQVDTYLYVFQAEQVTTLDLTDCQIEDISFLSYFANLEHLILDDNAISDIYPLKDLYQLKTLSLNNNQIDDTLPLYNLTKITELSLSHNNIELIEGLGNKPNLYSLDLSFNQIEDLTPIKNSDKLEILNVFSNRIAYLGVINDLIQLKELYIGRNYLKYYNGLAPLVNLEVLDIRKHEFLWEEGFVEYFFSDEKAYDYSYENEAIIEADVLSGMKNLRVLVVQDVAMKDITVLSELPKLEELVLDWNRGQLDFELIGELTQLKKLSLRSYVDCTVEDLSFLKNMTNLTHLGLGGQQAEDASYLSGLTQLEFLDLSGYTNENEWENTDNLSDISALAQLKSLKYLSLNGLQDIRDFSPLEELDNIEFLDIGSTYMFDLTSILHMKKLRGLNIGDTFTVSISGIENLKALEYLNPLYAKTLGYEDKYHMFGGTDAAYEVYNRYTDENGEFPEVKLSGLTNLKYVNVSIYRDGNEWLGLDMDYINTLPKMVNPERLEIWIGCPERLAGLIIRPYVKELIIRSPEFVEPFKIDLTTMDNLENIEKLKIEGFYLDDLSGLENCTKLTELIIENAGISDISALEGCTALKHISFINNNIEDISVLSNAWQLEHLGISNNNITDITPLGNCYQLQCLKINHNPVKYVDIVMEMPALTDFRREGVSYYRTPELVEYLSHVSGG